MKGSLKVAVVAIKDAPSNVVEEGDATHTNENVVHPKPEQTNPSEGDQGDDGNWDAPAQPLSKLFECQIISSPMSSHNGQAGNDDDDGDEHSIVDMSGIKEFDDVRKQPSMAREISDHTVSVRRGEDDEDDSVCSMSNSVLGLDMFEGDLPEDEDEDEDDCKEVTDDDSSKRSHEETPASSLQAEEAQEGRPVKRSKPTAPVSVFSTGTKAAAPAAKSSGPKQKRPNCLFINHLGSRLDADGRVTKRPASISIAKTSTEPSEEDATVATPIKEKPAPKETPDVPVSATSPELVSPRRVAVPSEVHIVTPASSKPTKEPLSSRFQENQNQESSGHHSPTPSITPPHMIPGRVAVNFNRPFPLLQRRAFLSGCHPHGMHPQAYGARHMHYGYPPNGIPFAPQLNGSHQQPHHQQWQN